MSTNPMWAIIKCREYPNFPFTDKVREYLQIAYLSQHDRIAASDVVASGLTHEEVYALFEVIPSDVHSRTISNELNNGVQP